MKTVYKYELKEDGAIDMPGRALILSVQVQYGKIYLWALVDTDKQLVKRKFIIRGTGHEINEEGLLYIGTIQLHGGSLVFHIFEIA